MAKIIPAILENTKDAFEAQLSRVVKIPGVERVQVDFADGIFVPNTTLPVTEIDVLTPTIHFEAHLMAQAPKDFLDYQICGFKTIIIHLEAYKFDAEIFQAIAFIKDQGMEAALCINPETPVGNLLKFAAEVKRLQLMSIHPGHQGTEFLESTYKRVEELRKLAPNAIIQVDGGLNETNIKQVAEAGADLLVVGSALIKYKDINQAYQWLYSRLTS